MEDVIYTLLIIAWIGYGIYSAAKKNSAKNNQPKQAPKKEIKSLDDLWDTFMEGKNLSQSSPAPIPYASVEDEEKDFESYEEPLDTYTDRIDRVPDLTPKSELMDYKGTDNVEQSINDQDEEIDFIKRSELGTETQDAGIDFDLKQAVIAQTILERPYA